MGAANVWPLHIHVGTSVTIGHERGPQATSISKALPRNGEAPSAARQGKEVVATLYRVGVAANIDLLAVRIGEPHDGQVDCHRDPGRYEAGLAQEAPGTFEGQVSDYGIVVEQGTIHAEAYVE